MYCHYHADRAAVRRCEKCGEYLCQECAVVVDGRSICKACVHHTFAERPVPKTTYRKKVNILMFLFLSVCLPGTNYMAMGLMKRGLFMMSSFFLSIYAIVLTGSPVFAFITAIIYVASFFDGFNIRSRMWAGEYIPDSIGDITGFLYKYRVPAVMFLVLVCLSSVFSRIFNSMNRFFGYPLSHSDFSLFALSGIIILFGIYIVYRGKSDRNTDKTIDKREHNHFD